MLMVDEVFVRYAVVLLEHDGGLDYFAEAGGVWWSAASRTMMQQGTRGVNGGDEAEKAPSPRSFKSMSFTLMAMPLDLNRASPDPASRSKVGETSRT